MLDQFKVAIENQYLAAFRTVRHCIDKCPDGTWNEPVCNCQIDQSIFHALFFADVYLGANPEAVEDQDFHRDHSGQFAGYEQWENRQPEKKYSREFIVDYLDHCKSKAIQAVSDFTESSLTEPSGFSWIKGTAAEVHIYNIRHIQHHAAQVSLRLRLNHQAEVPWVKSNWEE